MLSKPRSEAQASAESASAAHVALSLSAVSYRGAAFATTDHGRPTGLRVLTRRAKTQELGETLCSRGESRRPQRASEPEVDPHGHHDHGHTAALQALLHHERGLVVQRAIPERVFLEDQLARDE